MVRRSQVRALAMVAGLAVPAGLVGCRPPGGASATAASKPAAPAKSGHPKEADLATVELTPEAEKRLGVALVPVARKTTPRTSLYGGEVVIPPGRLIAVTSPFTGMLKAPEGDREPMPGMKVKEGQSVFVLVPMLSPESRATMAPLLIEAEGQVKQSAEQLKIAKVALERARELVRDKLGGSASLIDAQANYDLAQTTLRAAEGRQQTIAKVAASAESGTLDTQTIAAPSAGMIQNVHARPGQKVAANAPLFEVANLDPVWIKVPVYVGDLARLAEGREAAVGGLADAPGAPTRKARPVDAPPTGDPLSATVHVYYEVENKDGALRPGERVGVALPMKAEEQGLVVPIAALVRDIQGDAWVYAKTGEHTFTRRRVLVDRVSGDLAILGGGRLKPGDEVVTDGAAELFGTEFGGAK